jgi:citrate synthase
MKGPGDLLEHEDHWTTRMGLVFPGERVVIRGQDLFHELVNLRWMELFLYGITGRKFSENQIRLFEGIWTISTSYPDPRIWNNRVAALAGTARSTPVLAVGAAVSISEAKIYGFKPIIGAYNFIVQSQARMSHGESLEEIVLTEIRKYRSIPGYSRPFGNADERIDPLFHFAQKLGLSDGAYTNLAFQIEEIYQNNRLRLKINVAALAAALCADQGLSMNEYYHYLVPCFIGGMLPCFIDTQNNREGTFFPLSCERITYEGKANRTW